MSLSIRMRPALAIALLALPACGDGGTEPLIPFEPVETLDQLAEVMDPLSASGNLLLGLEAAADALTGGSGAALRPALDVLRPGGTGWTRATPLAAHTRSEWQPLLAFPSSVLGKTLVYDPVEGMYVVDPDRAGAPENGVRVAYYAMSPTTGRPAEPLNELGFIELTDEDTADSERLGIRVVDASTGTAVELVDYYVDLRFTGTGTQGSFFIASAGVLHHGPDELGFDLLQTLSWNSSANTQTAVVDYEYTADGVSLTYRLDAFGSFLGEAFDELAGAVTIADGTDEIEITFELTDEQALSGAIAKNGTTVIRIAGTEEAPTFTRADGSDVTQDDRDVLVQIWTAVSELLVVTERLFAPVVILLLPD